MKKRKHIKKTRKPCKASAPLINTRNNHETGNGSVAVTARPVKPPKPQATDLSANPGRDVAFLLPGANGQERQAA